MISYYGGVASPLTPAVFAVRLKQYVYVTFTLETKLGWHFVRRLIYQLWAAPVAIINDCIITMSKKRLPVYWHILFNLKYPHM